MRRHHQPRKGMDPAAAPAANPSRKGPDAVSQGLNPSADNSLVLDAAAVRAKTTTLSIISICHKLDIVVQSQGVVLVPTGAVRG